MTDSPDSRPPQNSELRNTLSSNRSKKKGLLIGLGSLVAAGLVIGGVFAVGSAFGGSSAPAAAGGTGDGAAEERISVKIAGSGESDFQDEVQIVAKEKGLDIEWVNFDDWVLPNSALVAGEVDANAFQHIAFLSAFNVANDADITPVISTVITQWGIFSSSTDSLEEIPDGARVAIPDDASNGGRALFILEDAGFITLADDAGTYPTVDDVETNEKGIEFVPIAATTIPVQYDDPSIDAVVVGTSYFDPAQGIDSEDALFLDDSLAESSLPYVNVIATRGDDVDNPAWDILADVYADERVATALETESFGNSVLVDVSIDALREKLVELEELARELG
jgi:D-methionine transport system substrate-binding protein